MHVHRSAKAPGAKSLTAPPPPHPHTHARTHTTHTKTRTYIHVRQLARLPVDAPRRLLAPRVLGAELRQDAQDARPAVLRQRAGYHLVCREGGGWLFGWLWDG